MPDNLWLMLVNVVEFLVFTHMNLQVTIASSKY